MMSGAATRRLHRQADGLVVQFYLFVCYLCLACTMLNICLFAFKLIYGDVILFWSGLTVLYL